MWFIRSMVCPPRHTTHHFPIAEPVLVQNWLLISGQGFLVHTRGQSPRFCQELLPSIALSSGRVLLAYLAATCWARIFDRASSSVNDQNNAAKPICDGSDILRSPTCSRILSSLQYIEATCESVLLERIGISKATLRRFMNQLSDVGLVEIKNDRSYVLDYSRVRGNIRNSWCLLT